MAHSMMFLKVIIKIARQNVMALGMMTHSITNLDVNVSFCRVLLH